MKCRSKSTGLIVFSVTLTLLLAACSPWATYPKIDGAAQIGRPQFEPLPSIMATAVRQAHAEAELGGEPVFNLPKGTPNAAYDAVLDRLGNGRPMRKPGEPAVHILEVRVRALDAEVDVIVPRRDGSPEMITYEMRQQFLHNYRVTSTKRWRIATDYPSPSYVVSAVDQ